MRGTKSEIRIPKSETNSKFKIANIERNAAYWAGFLVEFSGLFRILKFGFVSDFEIGISDLRFGISFMQPHDMSTPTGSKPPSKNPAPRSVLTAAFVSTLVLVVLMVGFMAWVIQYLPSRGKNVSVPPPPPQGKILLAFERPDALWRNKPAVQKKDAGPDDMEDPFKYVENGTSGHYDFPFKNKSEQKIEILSFVTTCDCTSVKACLLPAEEWERVNKEQDANPGKPLAYAKEPTWLELPNKPVGEPAKNPSLVVGPGEGGVVRVEWVANKPDLTVQPALAGRAAGDPVLYQRLRVPVLMRPAIQFDPPRVNAGVLTAGKTTNAVFDVWSSTREKLDFKLPSADPLFEFKVQKLEEDEFAAKAKDLAARKIAPRVLCAYRVSVTVHETKDGKHLDQGSFYRKFPFALEDKVDPNAPLWGPEIVGRVDGDIQVGGQDDQRRILFKSFNVKTRASKEVQLATDAGVQLKTYEGHPDQPSWIKVNLTREQASSNRVTWQLEVIVEPNTIGARSFDEPDAVVLQIVGTDPPRFVRIPIEGHVSR
jgi:hypothetical protein